MMLIAALIIVALSLGIAVVAIAKDDHARREHPHVQTVIMSHKNLSIIGDGGVLDWTNREKPKHSALIGNRSEPRGM